MTTFRPQIPREWFGYPVWEDYEAGMYRSDGPPDQAEASRALLADEDALAVAMLAVTKAWPIATAHNLTDQSSNRYSWLGQAACCLAHGASDKATCMGWWKLSDRQRDQANGVADRIIAEWEWERAGVLPLFNA